MSLRTRFSSFWTREDRERVYRSRPLPQGLWEELNSRQGKVSGFSLDVYQEAELLCIGAGGLGSNILQGAVRKGIRKIFLLDDDEVEYSNLTRQLFFRKDVGKNKALQLGCWLASWALFPLEVAAYPYRFLEALELGHDFSHVRAILCLVDNNPTRKAASLYGLQFGIPVIHAAVSRDGNSLYVAVQEPGKACFGCMLPHALNDESYPCQLPGIIDVLQVASGLVVYALDTILCGRHREWNFRSISLDGSLPDASRLIPKRKDCPLCGGKNENQGNPAG